jgi:hypothetical protein
MPIFVSSGKESWRGWTSCLLLIITKDGEDKEFISDDHNSDHDDDGDAVNPDTQDYDQAEGKDNDDDDGRDRGVDPRQPRRRNLTNVERQTLSRFYKQLEDSQDKLCFIEFQHAHTSKPS